MKILDTLAWAFTAQLITGFALAVWKHVSLSSIFQEGYSRSSIIGAILHGGPTPVSREGVAVGDKGTQLFLGLVRLGMVA